MGEAPTPWSYDQIADVYETDMGANLPYDDAAYFARLCGSFPGPVLEVGCGTGRVMLPLVARGFDVIGVDRSWPMLRRLRRDAQARGLDARAACMDARALAFAARFSLVIAPFSMVTYLDEPPALAAMLEGARRILRPDGALVLDAFIPKSVARFETFQRDYDRPHGPGRLVRRRRITPLGDGRNRIERRYELTRPDEPASEWTTVDVIRPYHAEELVAAAARLGFALDRVDHDYGAAEAGVEHAFATVILRLA